MYIMQGNQSNINVDKIVSHWIKTSNNDYDTMMTLFESKSYA